MRGGGGGECAGDFKGDVLSVFRNGVTEEVSVGECI